MDIPITLKVVLVSRPPLGLVEGTPQQGIGSLP